MVKGNGRYMLLSVVLLFILFAGVYFFSNSIRQFRPGYFVAFAILLYTGTALNRARTVISPHRLPITRETPKKLGLPAFEEVSFFSRDGLELSGWYIAPRNGAAVVLVHSLGGSRVQMRHHARALTTKGFGVLMFDLRAHARSSGSISSFGWIEHLDLLSAHDFLVEKAGIAPGRIGVAGFSLGAQIAVRAAVHEGVFAAVWADGLIPVVYSDHFALENRSLREIFFTPWWWLVYKTQEWLTGVRQPPPLKDVISELAPRPLMVVASGSDRLQDLGRAFYEAASEPRQFWPLDEIPFGTGILEFGDDYDFKLVGFFTRSLLKEQNTTSPSA